MTDKIKVMKYISRIKMYYKMFLKNFINKSILVNIIKKVKFLNFKYIKKD